MKEELLQVVSELKSDRRLALLDEAATKQTVILRVLSALDWDTHNADEVKPEHPVADTKVDYALKLGGKLDVFIEVKRRAEPLEKHQEQLMNYCFREGVPLAVLTDGNTWWFYLPVQLGTWEQRKFCSIDIESQPVEQIAAQLTEYLSKENVASGKAEENARAAYETRKKAYDIGRALPEVWHKLVTEYDPILVDLIADKTEKMCGFRPDSSVVKSFMSSNAYRFMVSIDTSFPKRLSPGQVASVKGHSKGVGRNRSVVSQGKVRFGNETYNSLHQFCKAKGIKYNGMRNALDAVERSLAVRTKEPLPYRHVVTDENGKIVHYDNTKRMIVNSAGSQVDRLVVRTVPRPA